MIADEKRADFIQNFCIFGVEMNILTSFQLDLWTIDRKKPLEPQGLGVIFLLRYNFQKKNDFSERSKLLNFRNDKLFRLVNQCSVKMLIFQSELFPFRIFCIVVI